MPDIERLIAVFEEARRWVALPENDFTWSSWIDTDQALGEIDGILAKLGRREVPSAGVLFAPTGPMQELALSSGWGDEFIDLANRYDEAIACSCFRTPLSPFEAEEMGMDASFGEVSLIRCPDCGQNWLRYYYVNEAFTGSGRWYLGAVPSSSGLTVENAKATLEGLGWYFYGGSYYDGQTGKTSGAISVP